MERTTVLKIGGGILRDKQSFTRVVEIVRAKKNAGEKQLVVISALYGITDYLIDSLAKCRADPAQVEHRISGIKKMHLDYLAHVQKKDVRQNAEFALQEKISVLEKFLHGVGYLGEISPRSRDLVQSFGERLSPIVLEAFLLDNGIDAVFVDAEEAGIICKGGFENAAVDMHKTQRYMQDRIAPKLAAQIVLLPGYYGIDDVGDVKTFGRGGTDYSSGFIANIFGARLEVWKDVSGFMTADPKVVPSAKQIPFLSYDEAEELGYLGAKILHPKTIFPLREKGLSAEIKNVFAPEVTGTIIGPQKHRSDELVKSIAATKGIAIVTVKSSAMVNDAGFASNLFQLLSRKNISVDLIATSETNISISIDENNLPAALESLKALQEIASCTISFEKDLSLIGVIGEGLHGVVGIAGKLFSALGSAGINVELITQASSEINITFVVKKKDHEKAIAAVHAAFIG